MAKRYKSLVPVFCACGCGTLIPQVLGRPNYYLSKWTRGHATRKGDEHRKNRRLNYERTNDRKLRQKYGITRQEYDAMLVKQGGVCKTCQRPPKVYRLHVDHDHVTGRVRGILCGRCNWVLGLIKDSPTLLKALQEYLQ